MKNIKAIFKTSDTQLLDVLCEVNNWGKIMSDRSTLNGSVEKIRFETSDTQLLDGLCDINTWGKIMSDRRTLNGSGEKNPV